MSGFEVGKSYRVLPEFYDCFDFCFDFCCGFWYDKYKTSVFLVEEVDEDGDAFSGEHFIATAREFKYCQEVLESPDYSKCLYDSPEYLGYYVSFTQDGVKNFTHINEPEIDKTGKNLIFLNNEGMLELVPIGNLTFYQEDGSECSFEDLT